MNLKLKIFLLFLILQFFAILIFNQVYAKQDAGYWYNKGYEATDLDKKIEYYTKAIKLDPKYADAYYNRGIAYAHKGLYDSAIEDFNKAIELNPKHAFAYTNRGIAYEKLGNCTKANEDYKKACSLGCSPACSYKCY